MMGSLVQSNGGGGGGLRGGVYAIGYASSIGGDILTINPSLY